MPAQRMRGYKDKQRQECLHFNRESIVSNLPRVSDITAWPLQRNNRRKHSWQQPENSDAWVVEHGALQELGSSIQQHCPAAQRILPPCVRVIDNIPSLGQ